MDKPAQEELLFSYSEERIQVGDFAFILCMIRDLDEALDHYVKVSPSETDRIPYFTRLWESAEALANFIVERRSLFAGKRVLELGCGLGLPALCAARSGACVTASDFHPDNQAFFLRNARLNGLEQIHYQRMDWREPELQGPFDILLGSDLIYEKQMVSPLVNCVKRYLLPGGTFFYADPGRSALQDFTSELEQAGLIWELLPRHNIYLQVWNAIRPESKN
ncbi:MAG: methyltransferase domain-containing protein [Lentisphaeria bacterium]